MAVFSFWISPRKNNFKPAVFLRDHPAADSAGALFCALRATSRRQADEG
jgi:hypothetical protein